MNNSHVDNRRHGLTPLQLGVLVVAFVIGLGSTFVVREFFPPSQAGIVQNALSSHVAAK